jgi:hypothetical protein
MKRAASHCGSWASCSLAALALTVAACSEELPPTQVVVSLQTDLDVNRELERIEVQTFDRSGRFAGDKLSFPLTSASSGDGRFRPPFSFGLTKGRETQILLVVTGFVAARDGAAATAAIEYKARVAFRSRQTLLLDVFLGRACYGKLCGPDSTCTAVPSSALTVATCGAVADARLAAGRPGDEFDSWRALADSGWGEPGDADARDAGDAAVAAIDAAMASLPAEGGARTVPPLPDAGADAMPPLPDAGGGQRDPCAEQGCEHGASCRASGTTFSCDCGASGYTGQRCESDIDECASSNGCSSPDYPCIQTEAPGYVCAGQYADWSMPDALPGAKFAPAYDLSVAGVVVDRVTGLMWQRELASSNAGCSGTLMMRGDVCTQPEAEAYCAGLELAGKSDWRLPTAIELASIVDLSKQPAIDGAAFPNTPGEWHWTSSTFLGATVSAWEIDFQTGVLEAVTDNATSHDRARCVRTVATSLPSRARYQVDAALDVISDTPTGLVWQRSARRSDDWAAAKSGCASLPGGFRLPTLKELLTLVDFTRLAPTIDPLFPNTSSQIFWSSSPGFGSTVDSWGVDFATGHALKQPAASVLPSRCVR